MTHLDANVHVVNCNGLVIGTLVLLCRPMAIMKTNKPILMMMTTVQMACHLIDKHSKSLFLPLPLHLFVVH